MLDEGCDEVAQQGLSVRRLAAQVPVFESPARHACREGGGAERKGVGGGGVGRGYEMPGALVGGEDGRGEEENMNWIIYGKN